MTTTKPTQEISHEGQTDAEEACDEVSKPSQETRQEQGVGAEVEEVIAHCQEEARSWRWTLT
jgi:hypothetical protein